MTVGGSIVGRGEKLPILDTVAEAYQFPLINSATLIRLMVVPLILSYAAGFAVGFLVGYSGEAQGTDDPSRIWAAVARHAQWIFFAAFAVAWHRVVLLGPTDAKVRTSIGMEFGKREIKFFVAWVLLFYLVAGPGNAFSLYASQNPEFLGSISGLTLILYFIYIVLAVAVVTKLSLMYPEIALNKNISIPRYWKKTKKCTIRMLMIILITGIPVPTIMILLFSRIIESAKEHFILYFIADFLYLFVIFTQIAITASGISLIYQWIMNREDLPQPDRPHPHQGRRD